MRKVVKLRQLATPDQIELSHQVDQVFVITDDGTRTAAILAKTLQKQGWNHIAVLQFPAVVFPSSHHLPKNAHLFP